MTKEELIAEAKRRYPHGTKFISAGSDLDIKTLDINNINVYYYWDGDIDGGQGCGYLYYEGKWAKIVNNNELIFESL